MMFRTRTRKRRGPLGIDITPLIDALFNLIIFLIITANAPTSRIEAFEIDLATAINEGQSVETEQHTVYVTDEGLFYFLEPAGETAAPPTSPTLLDADALRQKLETLHDRDNAASIAVRGAQTARYQMLMSAVSIIQEIGFQKITLPYKKE